MAGMNYDAGEVTNFTIEFTLQHCARCDKVFHAARTNLKPEHFSKPGESVYKAVWSAMLDYYERRQELPTYEALSMRVMTAVATSPLPGMAGMTDVSLQNADDLLKFMYSDAVLTPDEAIETLREILLDRDAGDALRAAVLNAGGRHIHDLPKLLEKQQRRAEEITAIGKADDDDSTIPDNWDSVLRPRWPTGVPFVDKIMEGGSEAGDCNVILGSTGGGKCLGKGTPVLLHTGKIIPVEHIRVGDTIMGPDSKPRYVTGITSGAGPLYEIRPVKGMPYIVNDAHILTLVITDTDKQVDICVKDYISSSKTFKHKAKGFSVGVEFPYQETTLEPYFVGLWLGDGSSASQRIWNTDTEIVNYLRKYATTLGLSLSVVDDKLGRCPGYAITGIKGIRNPVIRGLKKMCNNKHIPKEYKINSREMRLELLAGICDSDGWLHRPGNFQIMQKSFRLANDIAFLARSLGFAAYLSSVTKTCCNNGKVGSYWCVSIVGDVDTIPTKVLRKQSPRRLQKKCATRNGITVTAVGTGEYFGFELAGNEKHFLLGDFTVTHNTTLSMQLACSISHMQITYERPDSEITPGLIVFVGYEDGKRMQQIRAGACAAHVVKNRLQSAREGGAPLSTTGNLQPYEQAMYQRTPSTKERLGEQERLEEIKPWMNKYLALVDYHDHSKGGRGHVTEICQKLHALQQKRGLPVRTVIIDWAGEMVDNYLLATYGKVESGAKALELGGLVRRCKSEIAVPFNSTVWVSHQMAGRFTSSAPARRPHHSEANWCTSFADNAWFAFCLGTKDEEHSVCQFVATKTRHGESGAPVILKFTAFSRLEDVSDKFKPDHAGMRLLPKDDVDRIQVAPSSMPKRKNHRNSGSSDLDNEI